MSGDPLSPRENPFSSRYVRPGALPFLFPPGDSLDAFVTRFIAAERRGAVIGPHGAGKSTLVEALLPRLREGGCEARACVLRQGERTLRRGFDVGLRADDVLIVDGYEQLGLSGRWGLRRAVRSVGCGLLVTSHRPVRGMPTLFVARPTVEMTAALVARLIPTDPIGPITPADVERLFNKHGGDVREVLFGLYDLYESRRS